jgi:hypothetical protein
MSYTYSFDKNDLSSFNQDYADYYETHYADTIFDTPETDNDPTDLFSDWADEDLAQFESYYLEQFEADYNENEELQQEARNNNE